MYLPSLICHSVPIRLQVSLSFIYLITWPSCHSLNKLSFFLSQGVFAILVPLPGTYGWLPLNTHGSRQLSDPQTDLSGLTYLKYFSFFPAHNPLSSSPSISMACFFPPHCIYHYLEFFINLFYFTYFCFIYMFIYKMLCFIHYYFSST